MSPLPFAPPPKDSSLYQQLESTTLQTLTPDQLDTIRAKTFSQGTEGNEDEYRRLLLLGLASDKLSVSGPIPGTAQIINQAFSEANENDLITLLQPGVGEVWILNAASVSFSGGTSGVSLFLADQSISSTDMVFLGQESSSGVLPFNPSPHRDIYITNETYLVGQGYSIDTGETSTLKVAVIRVR